MHLHLAAEPAVDLAIAFLGGLTGSLHCIGMCGGFPLALAAARAQGAPAGAAARNGARQLLYNLGRLNTLVFIGALSGALGGALVALGPARALEGWLAALAGAVMIAIGLEMLGLLARVSGPLAALVQTALSRTLAPVIASPSPLAPIALGVFNAFLPCHLIYAFAARAAATASPPAGALTMLAFGLGTIPAMLALGTVRSIAPGAARAALSRASGILVIAFGCVTLLRGLAALGATPDALHGAHGTASHAQHALHARASDD